ncbi:hypothetical protein SAMN05216567_115140 [Variovorax sp. OK605]|jgi:hypothetical protein|nr:hypothetical protein [Variovorax sp. OK605]SFQ41333.1 hypothetical protein SAMN05216567_115140 [Variovorax sp. OK605]
MKRNNRRTPAALFGPLIASRQLLTFTTSDDITAQLNKVDGL